MNWYKKAQKYTDIGHYFWSDRRMPPNTKEFTWIIDKDWRFHYFESDPDSQYDQTHHDRWSVTELYDSVAKGRAVIGPNKSISSAVLSHGITLARFSYYQPKVEKILEKELGVDQVKFY